MPVSSVKKAMELLDILAFEDVQQRGIAVSALARRRNLPVNTAHNLLKSLAACGYVGQNADGLYIAGPKCRQLGAWNRLQTPAIRSRIEPALTALGEQLNERVVLVALVDGNWSPVAQRDASRAVAVNPASNLPDNIYTVTTGRVLTSFCSSEDRTRIVERHGLPGKRWGHLRSAAALDRACKEIRAAGYALIERETEGYLMFAFPVLAPASGRLIGALGCSAPQFRCSGNRLQQMLKQVEAAATALARQLV